CLSKLPSWRRTRRETRRGGRGRHGEEGRGYAEFFRQSGSPLRPFSPSPRPRVPPLRVSLPLPPRVSLPRGGKSPRFCVILKAFRVYSPFVVERQSFELLQRSVFDVENAES